MSPELIVVSSEAARGAVVRSLGFPALPSATETVRFELLRALTWALTSGSQPVHVVRLLNRAISIISPLVQESDDREVRAQFRDALEALADAGDLVELDGGLWLPGTSRLVRLGGDE